jgi:hypothetical protein
MYKLNQKDREKARELSIKESKIRRTRDLAKAELDLMLANTRLWDFLEKATGINFHSDDCIWMFDFKKGEVCNENENSLYTDQQIAGWKWQPLWSIYENQNPLTSL